MVTLDHQKFWQPPANPPERFSSIVSESRTTVVAEQLRLDENCGANRYIRESNLPQRVQSIRFWLVNLQALMFETLWFMINLHPQNFFIILDPIRLKSMIMMNRPPTVTLITLRKSHFSFVTRLNRPRSARVFDVFRDENASQSNEHNSR